MLAHEGAIQGLVETSCEIPAEQVAEFGEGEGVWAAGQLVGEVYECRLHFRHTGGEREVGVFQCAGDLVVRDFELGHVELGNKKLEDVQKDAEHQRI